MARVLVLGSEGLIGKNLVTHLESQGHTVRGWDKKNSPKEDLASSQCLVRLHNDCVWADRVFFLAFEVGGAKYLTKADKTIDFVDENVSMLLYCMRVLEASKTPFLYASSQMSNMVHTSYGKIKSLAETYCDIIPNGRYCRFWNVYGEEDIDEKSHVVTDFIKSALTPPHQINMMTNGEEERQFLHVRDAVMALECWLEGVFDETTIPLDITSFEWITIKDLALKIADILKRDCNIEVSVGCQLKEDTLQKGFRNEPDISILSFWTPKLTLEQGLRLRMCI